MRHHTVVDVHGGAAFDRLRHEQAVLTRLEGLGIAFAVLDYWAAGDSLVGS